MSSVFDRLLGRLIPRPLADHTPPARAIAEGLWVLERELVHFGFARLPARTTIIRLESGNLVVISAPPRDPACEAAFDMLGPVACVVVPNPFHYVFAQAFLERHPGAELMAAPGLIERVPKLGFATVLGGEPPAAWAGVLAVELVGSPGGATEVVLFHRPSGSLILTDVAFNMREHSRGRDRVFWRASGIPAGFGPGRTSRALLLNDHAAAAKSLARMLEWPVGRIIPAHGDIIEDDAASALRAAFADYFRSNNRAGIDH